MEQSGQGFAPVDPVDVDDPSVWAISCFFIRVKARAGVSATGWSRAALLLRANMARGFSKPARSTCRAIRARSGCSSARRGCSRRRGLKGLSSASPGGHLMRLVL